jgi:gas vesicle protein
MRDELGESWEHFLAAATHAANGMGQKVGPGTTKVRGAASRSWGSTAAALAPLAAAYREGAADATAAALKLKKKAQAATKGSSVSKHNNSKRTGLLLGLVAGGVAIGVASALVMRRRRQQQWAEYDSASGLDSMSADARSMADRAAHRADRATDKMSSKAEDAVDKLSHHTGNAMDKTTDKLRDTASNMRSGKSEVNPKINETAERANDATDNLASKYGSSSNSNKGF